MQRQRLTRLLWLELFLVFAALNVYALVSDGFLGLKEALTAGNSWNLVFMVDLVIALGMVLAWIWRDARRRGVSPIPYAVLTATTGSIGTLLYLVRYSGDSAATDTGKDSVGKDSVGKKALAGAAIVLPPRAP